MAVAGVAATVWYRSLPCGYEASSGFLYDLRGHMRTNGMSFSADVGDAFAEIYFTRLPEWKSERVVRKTVKTSRLPGARKCRSDPY